eukprot:3932936-Rhodomonas_salina.1
MCAGQAEGFVHRCSGILVASRWAVTAAKCAAACESRESCNLTVKTASASEEGNELGGEEETGERIAVLRVVVDPRQYGGAVEAVALLQLQEGQVRAARLHEVEAMRDNECRQRLKLGVVGWKKAAELNTTTGEAANETAPSQRGCCDTPVYADVEVVGAEECRRGLAAVVEQEAFTPARSLVNDAVLCGTTRAADPGHPALCRSPHAKARRWCVRCRVCDGSARLRLTLVARRVQRRSGGCAGGVGHQDRGAAGRGPRCCRCTRPPHLSLRPSSPPSSPPSFPSLLASFSPTTRRHSVVERAANHTTTGGG